VFAPYMLGKKLKAYMHVYYLKAIINFYNIKDNENTKTKSIRN
jgi:hypothetical protein